MSFFVIFFSFFFCFILAPCYHYNTSYLRSFNLSLQHNTLLFYNYNKQIVNTNPNSRRWVNNLSLKISGLIWTKSVDFGHACMMFFLRRDNFYLFVRQEFMARSPLLAYLGLYVA